MFSKLLCIFPFVLSTFALVYETKASVKIGNDLVFIVNFLILIHLSNSDETTAADGGQPEPQTGTTTEEERKYIFIYYIILFTVRLVCFSFVT